VSGEGIIRVLIAERSASERARLAALLRCDPTIEIVGEATESAEVVERVKRLKPHVALIDIHLPPAGGFEATKEIMIEAPTPIVVVSNDHDARQVEMSILALRAGALAVVSRPAATAHPGDAAMRLVPTVKAMAQVKVVRRWRDPSQRRAPLPARMSPSRLPRGVIAIAASTGGPAALQDVLSQLPAEFPIPILVVQHISDGFVEGLVSWLNTLCSLKVKVAESGEPLAPHTVYFAPNTGHLGIAERSKILISHADPIGGFRPSATFLFASVAEAFGRAAVHVILTGMGQDGVAGLHTARQRGGTVIAQDEASSVVFGMPGAAVAAGVVDRVVPLGAVVRELLALAEARGNGA
jgi:two-component system, chemotaxis family, protein-glutamate methylesterase/glutaminase